MQAYLAFLHLVPAFNEMLDDIQHDGANKCHVNVMPRHSCTFEDGYSTTRIVINIFEIFDSRVIVVLAREQSPVEFSRMNISQRVVVRIPSTEA